jgi:hypothetical protein
MFEIMREYPPEIFEKVLFCHPEPGSEFNSGSKDFRVSKPVDFIRC